jgi:hypothetical protein
MSKKINKKNEEKLKIYLSKLNDIKPGNTKDQRNSAGAQTAKGLSTRPGN